MEKVVISTRSFGEYDSAPIERLKDCGFKLSFNPYGRSLTPDESIEFLKDAIGLIAGTEPLTEEVLKRANSLRVISRCGVGMDNIDLDAAKRLGIEVINTPDAPTQAVAELTIGLMISVYRRIPETDRSIRSGNWSRQMGQLLFGKKLGVIGLGRIGKRLVELTTPFKLEIVACEPFPDTKFVSKYKIRLLALRELLQEADIVSLHLPLSPSTYHLIGKDELTLMRPDSVLINTSRGGIVDEEALRFALQNKEIAGAALDIFENEPYNGPLKEINNVILTTHIGSYARESRIQMELESVDNLIKTLNKVR